MARIVDFTSHSAIYATRLFAEIGHDVIRVESPQGDALRRLGPYLGGTPHLEHGAYHQFLNAGKRSLTLNLDSSLARGVFMDLIRTADVLVATLPLPIDETSLIAANPQLVFVKVVDDEPELLAYARSGLLSITGHPGEQPVLLGGHVAYAATGQYVAVATMAALYVLQETGQGQVVSVSVQQCLESLNEQAMVNYTLAGKETGRQGYKGAITAVSGAFVCADGYWMVSVPSTSEGWSTFMEWVQDPVLMADPSLADEAERQAKKDFILDRLEAWSRRFSKEELVLEAQRRHIPASPVVTPLDLAQDPQLLARGFLTEVEHPKFGRMMVPRGAIATMAGAGPNLAPTLGQHNAEILAELGYSEEEHRALVENGAM